MVVMTRLPVSFPSDPSRVYLSIFFIIAHLPSPLAVAWSVCVSRIFSPLVPRPPDVLPLCYIQSFCGPVSKPMLKPRRPPYPCSPFAFWVPMIPTGSVAHKADFFSTRTLDLVAPTFLSRALEDLVFLRASRLTVFPLHFSPSPFDTEWPCLPGRRTLLCCDPLLDDPPFFYVSSVCAAHVTMLLTEPGLILMKNRPDFPVCLFFYRATYGKVFSPFVV